MVVWGGRWAKYKEESTMNGEEVWGGLGEHTCGGLNYVGSGNNRQGGGQVALRMVKVEN